MTRLGRRLFFYTLGGVASLGLAHRAKAASALAELIANASRGAPVNQDRVKLDMPRLADNGHSVPLKVSVQSPMVPSDYVRSLTLLSERNPRPVMAKFYFNPRVGRAEVVTRVRLNGTQRVVALAELSDGSFWSASAEVEVTESACLDAT